MKKTVINLVIVLAMLIGTAATTSAQENSNDSISAQVEELRLALVDIIKTKPGEGKTAYYYAKESVKPEYTRYVVRFNDPSGETEVIYLKVSRSGKEAISFETASVYSMPTLLILEERAMLRRTF